MRWQKIARLVIAAFVIVFAAVVFVAVRRPAPRPEAAGTTRTDKDSVAEVRGTGEYVRHAAGKVSFKVLFESQLMYPDGRNVLKNATITLPDRNGRTITVTGGEAELVAPNEGQTELSTARLSKNVTLKASDGLEVRSADATYDDKTGVVTVPGQVEFTRGRMTGSGVGATYDRTRDVLWLLERAKIVVTPAENGSGTVEATAGAAGLARAEHYVRLDRDAHVVGDGRTLDAQAITFQLTSDDRLIQSVTLRGDSRIAGAPGAAGAEGMSARDIDLTYGPDGRSLQEARLMENAVVQLAGSAATGARRIAARSIDMMFGPDGSTVTGLSANENVQVDLPAADDTPARRINSATLSAGGASGLQTATFGGGVVYHETRPAGRGAPAGDRTGRSQRLVVETQPGLGAIQQADFRGNVQIVDGVTTAEGQRAIYKIAQDSLDLAPSGEPGPPPSVNDGRVVVNARTISFTVSTRKLRADTDVRSSFQPAKRGEKAVPNASGRGGASTDGAKLPSMLKQDEPVNVASDRLEYDGAAGTAIYTGAAKLFQDQTSILGDRIVLDDRTANLTAHGHVRTVMFLEETDSKTKSKKLVETIGTGDTLVYEDAKRLATYKTGPTAKAHIQGTQGDVAADTIRLFMKEGANELERAEADGAVVVKEGPRTATGQHLTYTPANETYVMKGSPVEIEEKTPADCKITVGTEVTFRRTNVDMTITNNGISPVTLRQCTPKAHLTADESPDWSTAKT